MADRLIWKTRSDEKTCEVCRSYHNKVYYSDKAPSLPAHDNCRCKLVTYKGAAVERLGVDRVGRSYWDVMFSKAYSLPEDVSNNQRLQFRNDILQLVKSYPCSDCVTDTVAWMKNNKLEAKSRDDVLNYLCNMKNMVNSKTGKDIYDCTTLLTSETMTHNPPTHQQTCSQCDSHPGEKHSEAEYNPESSGTSSEQRSFVVPDLVRSESENKQQNRNENAVGFKSQTHELYKSFKDYKSLSAKIIRDLCKTYRIPEPEIVFGRCPDGSNKSCVVSKTIYLDPNQYSARTLLHEFVHYHANYRGDSKLDVDEAKIDTIAQGLIDKSFNFVNNNNGSALVRHDTFITPEHQRRSTNFLENWKSQFPMLQKAMNYDPNTSVVLGPNGQPATAIQPQPQQPGGSGIVQPQPVIIQNPRDDPSTGLMAMFDNVYTPFANLLGLSARDVNEAHTPSIIQNAVTTLAEANLSDLGAVSVSLFSSIVLLAMGTLGKDHIVIGDRKLMAEMGAGFLWNSMRYVGNPKSMDTINDDAKNLGEALSKWNTDQSIKIVTTDKRDMRKTQQVKRMMENRRKMMGGGQYMGGGEPGDVIFSKSGPNGPTESAFSTDEMGMMGMTGGPMVFTADGGRPTRVLVGSDGKTIMKSMHKPENRGADIKGLIGTTQNANPYNRAGPFTFVGGNAVGTGEPDRRPHKRQRTGEYLMDDLDGDFVPQEYEGYYRPQQEFPNLAIT